MVSYFPTIYFLCMFVRVIVRATENKDLVIYLLRLLLDFSHHSSWAKTCMNIFGHKFPFRRHTFELARRMTHF